MESHADVAVREQRKLQCIGRNIREVGGLLEDGEIQLLASDSV